MGEAIVTIILLIIGLVVAGAVLSFVLSALGLVLWFIPLLIKVAIYGGLIYLGWLVFRKITDKKIAD